jgi:hypothetical protein
VDGSYVIIENIEFAFTQAVKGAFSFLAPAHHVALRNSEVRGNLNGGGIALASYTSATSNNLVVYNNVIHDNGNPDATFDQDVHGIVVGGAMSHVWIVDNEMYRNSGDGLQINSGGSSHHIYVGRNESHDNKQNGMWTKRASDVIFSENLVYSQRPSDSAFGAGLGMQYGPERVWFLYNHIHDCETGIGVASDTGDGGDGLSSYYVGNVIHDIHSAGGFNSTSAWSGGAAMMLIGSRNRYVVNNTIHDADAGINVANSGPVYFVNNMISGLTQPAGSHIFVEQPASASASTMHHNLLGGAPRIKWGGNSPVYTLATFQSATGKGQGSLNATPLFADPATHDFHLEDASPGIDAGIADAVYATFQSLYGLDIARDRSGVHRPQGNAWDMGGFEAAGAASPELRIDDVTVTEGNGGSVNATFTVSLSTASGQTVSVSYATANGTAAAGTDYTAASGTLSFTAGTLTRQVTVAVTGDTSVEASETFFVNLSNATGATIADGQGRGTINDNDQPLPALSINDVTVTEGNTGTVNATFTVALSAASASTVSVSYATANGTAAAGTDYTAASGTLSFTAGALTRQVTVAVTGDTSVEASETFFVNLSNATGATIADAQGLGAVVNDDLPALSINDVTVTEGAAGTVSATFTASLSSASAGTVTVGYATGGGTATAGTDYVAASGTLTIPPGSTTATVTVSVNGDSADEADETFVVTLSGATGATIADAQGVGTIVDDDTTGTPTEDAVWRNPVGVTITGNSIIKTAASGWGNAGATSSKGIAEGAGYVEFIASERNTSRALGLSNGDTNDTLTDIDFGIYITASGSVNIYEKGAPRGTFTTYAAGDRLRVAVDSGVVKYSRNGVVFYTSAAAPVYPLLVDTALQTSGATLTNAVLAGSLVDVGPVWGPAESVVWTSAIGVTVAGDDLTKTAAHGWGNAGAASTRKIVSGTGYAAFTASETSTSRMVGLSNGDSDDTHIDIDFAIYVTAVGTVDIYEKGAPRGTVGVYVPGDVLRIAVESGVVRYYRNTRVVYTSTAAPVYPLLVDTALLSTGGTIKDVVISGSLQ